MKNTPSANDTDYYYLSNEGETLYAPSTPRRQDTLRYPHQCSDTLHDTRLPRSSTPSRGSERSSSVPPTTSTASEIDEHAEARKPSDTHPIVNSTPTLGLPKDWIIFPLSKDPPRDKASHGSMSSGRKGLHFSRPNSSHHERASSRHGSKHDYQDVDPRQIDYSKPLAFELSTEFATPAPSYHSCRSSSLDSQSSLPPYPSSPTLYPKAGPERLHAQPHHSLFFKAESQERLAHVHGKPAVRITGEKVSQFKKPKLHHSRPLPREFTEQELHEIRRRTRHCIRVVTRTSIGLTSTLALSSVAPQLLIAAAVNAYCLGRGALELHEQLRFLKDNELKVKKKDVVIAVVEGIAVKVAFMAITINHDDFVVLAHEVLDTHALGLFDIMQTHPVPGFETLNELFIKPMEHAQINLGIPTMAERAADMSGVGTLFGDGGWNSADTSSLLGNIFLVGAIQGAMEQWVDIAYDQLGQATRFIRERLEWKFMRRRQMKEGNDGEHVGGGVIGWSLKEEGEGKWREHVGDARAGELKESKDPGWTGSAMSEKEQAIKLTKDSKSDMTEQLGKKETKAYSMGSQSDSSRT